MVAGFKRNDDSLVFTSGKFVLSFASSFLVILLFFSLIQIGLWFVEQGE